MTRQETDPEMDEPLSDTAPPRFWAEIGLAVCVLGAALVIAAAIGIEMSRLSALPGHCD